MNKIKVNINRKEVSSDEVTSRQNFKSVLKKTVTVSKPLYKKPGFITSVIITTTVVISTAAYYYKRSEHTTERKSVAKVEKIEPKEITKVASQQGNKAVEPFINPPLKKVNIKYNSYKVNATKGGEITHSTGSKIKIPARAFKHKDGKEVKGDVEIRYREFHDVPSIFVSGIPMTYDSAGTRYHFESSGMMDIQGYQNGERVDVADGKELHVEMVSKNADKRFNLYALDEEKRNWTYLGKPDIRKNLFEKDQDFKAGTEETEERTSSIKYKEEADAEIKKDPQINTLVQKKESVKKAIARLEFEEKPVLPRKANDKSYRFTLDVDKKEFPELALYEQTQFEVDDTEKDFNAEMYKITWEDAQLSKGTQAKGDYFLSLKKAKRSVKMLVYPVFEGKDYEKAKKEYDQKFLDYSTKLTDRKNEEERLQKEYETKVAEVKRKYEEMYKKWESDQKKLIASMEVQQKVFNVFTVSGFGVYNCDCPSKYPSGAKVLASLYSQSGEKLTCSAVYLAEKKRNAMFSMGYNDNVTINYNPKHENVLWTVTADKKLAILKPERFNDLARKGAAIVNMEVLDVTLESVEDVKKALEL